MKALIELVGNTVIFENLRVSVEHKEVFVLFVDYCFAHFCFLINWRYNAYTTVVYAIFTEPDKAFTILFLKKIKQLQETDGRKEKINKRRSPTIYTKDVNLNKRFRGWSRKGIQGYNKLISILRRNRNIVHCKEMEVEVMDNYKTIYRKTRQTT